MSVVSPEIEQLLSDERLFAHLATSVDDRPHVAPVWFYYENDQIDVLTTGRKLENIRKNPRVGLSIQYDVDGDTRWMVAIQGTATIVDDPTKTSTATRRLNEKYGVRPGAYEDRNKLVRIDVGSATLTTYD